jgi:pimeloyl-ACP methyl ester carboxylesterase
LDDIDQPMIVSGPTSAEGRLPLLIMLHDTILPATREAFVESALWEAARWKASLTDSEQPFLFMQPAGRGNGDWLGPAGRDLFAAIDALDREAAVDRDRITLIGRGAGATGALLLGCRFPARFSRLILSYPAFDDDLLRPPGDGPPPPWEVFSRESRSPGCLLTNLAQTPVLLDYHLPVDGLNGSAHPEHTRRLELALRRSGVPVEVAVEEDDVLLADRWPTDPARFTRWSLQPTAEADVHRSLVVYSTRTEDRWIRVDRLASPTKPAHVTLRTAEKKRSLKTRCVSDLAIQMESGSALDADKTKFAGDVIQNARDDDGFVHLQRRGDQWELAKTKKTGRPPSPAVKCRGLSGPIADLFWDRVGLVVGTIGDDRQTSAAQHLAEHLRTCWTKGEGIRWHPADASTLVDYEIRVDAEVDDAWLASRHVVVIGTPLTNMLLARWRGRVGCGWSTADDGREPIELGGRSFSDHQDGLILLGAQPDVPGRYSVIVTGVSVESYAWAGGFCFPLLPDYVAFRGPNVLTWGSCGDDWQPTGTSSP